MSFWSSSEWPVHSHTAYETEEKQKAATKITFSSEPNWMAAYLKILLRIYHRPRLIPDIRNDIFHKLKYGLLFLLF